MSRQYQYLHIWHACHRPQDTPPTGKIWLARKTSHQWSLLPCIFPPSTPYHSCTQTHSFLLYPHLPSKYPASQIFCHSHIFLLGKGCPAHLRRLSLLLQLKCLPEPHWKRTSSLPVMWPSLRANSRLWRQQYLKSACKFAVLATNIRLIYCTHNLVVLQVQFPVGKVYCSYFALWWL